MKKTGTIRTMRKAIFLIGAVTFFKLLFLTRTPLFGDEGLYCYLGYQMQQQGLSGFWRETIFMWKDAPLLPFLNGLSLMIPKLNPIIACRGTVVIISALGALLLWQMSNSWFVLLFYMLNPFSFFTDRTSLMEPVFVAMVLFYCWAIFKNKKFMGLVAMALMFLAKQTAFLAWLIPGLLGYGKRQYYLWLLPLAGLFFVGLRWFTPLWETAQMHARFDFDLVRIKQNLWLMGSWLAQYWEWPGVILVVLGGFLAVWRKRVGFLLIFVMIGGIYAVAGYTLFPRYLLILVPFMVMLVGEVTKFRWGKIVTAGVLLLFVHKDWAISRAPEKAAIAKEDHYQFFEDWSSGIGTKAAIEYLLENNFSGNLFVPQDIKGLWVTTQLTYAPDQNWKVYFYAPPVEIRNEGLLVSTPHHALILQQVRSTYQTQLLFASNGEARNSVGIEELR